ncbi:PLD nuclease N-terminal domain-containing protein [Aequorivita sp. F47161]|uniref:PLD nuclease N-terminal domain-containing protein n=2 Tax=Aequorivita vitellina TaxID=2874475 RepID=A0A9X1QUC7_9FLAO|nr:PLD nuclease N-terminal domain-containing protein [Aequorivita vitellina]MCG2419651.1 PLD nuclease N-terminal domain-containing protein [Aequorivita vitellina]
MIGVWQIIILSLVGVFILSTLLALIDILKNEFPRNNKIVWIHVVLLGSFFGAILYFLIGRNQKIKHYHK